MTEVGRVEFLQLLFLLCYCNSGTEQWQWIWSMINLEMREQRLLKCHISTIFFLIPSLQVILHHYMCVSFGEYNQGLGV